ncbi:hypothetical protein MTR_3g011720 [Medicago truncatula]|uniref:Uncharacterized protein n=1 Tax=Medicago truncatula TaxID=3880 RepID=A0A072V468_MEDTR|nr:hypothetical protein MTR_3g011720 [Medicago truncatula]
MSQHTYLCLNEDDALDFAEKTNLEKLEKLDERVEVASIEKIVGIRLRLFGHVERRSIDFVVRRVDRMESSQITRY